MSKKSNIIFLSLLVMTQSTSLYSMEGFKNFSFVTGFPSAKRIVKKLFNPKTILGKWSIGISLGVVALGVAAIIIIKIFQNNYNSISSNGESSPEEEVIKEDAIKPVEEDTVEEVAGEKEKTIEVDAMEKAAALRNINEKDKDGSTKLHRAARYNNTKAVKRLLEKGANINEKNFMGRTALYLAIYNHNAEVVKLLLEKGANINEKYEGGFTVLHIAAYAGDEEVIRILLEKGLVNIDEKNSSGRTAIQVAARYNESVVGIFINYGAEVN